MKARRGRPIQRTQRIDGGEVPRRAQPPDEARPHRHGPSEERPLADLPDAFAASEEGAVRAPGARERTPPPPVRCRRGRCGCRTCRRPATNGGSGGRAGRGHLVGQAGAAARNRSSKSDGSVSKRRPDIEAEAVPLGGRRACPPMCARRSRTRSRGVRRRGGAKAAARPPTPPPMTTTSATSGEFGAR